LEAPNCYRSGSDLQLLQGQGSVVNRIYRFSAEGAEVEFAGNFASAVVAGMDLRNRIDGHNAQHFLQSGHAAADFFERIFLHGTESDVSQDSNIFMRFGLNGIPDYSIDGKHFIDADPSLIARAFTRRRSCWCKVPRSIRTSPIRFLPIPRPSYPAKTAILGPQRFNRIPWYWANLPRLPYTGSLCASWYYSH
jgi:hypothetical protein